MIYFNNNVKSKSIKLLGLRYHQLMGKIEEHKGKKYLTVDDYLINKVLDKIKGIIGIKKFDDIKILIDTDDKLPDYITLKKLLY